MSYVQERRVTMVTTMPSPSSRLDAISQRAPSVEELTQALQPWQGRLITQQALHWTARGVLAGLICACLILALSRLLPWATAPYWASGIAVACAILAFFTALWYRPSLDSTTRIVDAQLKLHNRMSTAWELRTATSTLVRLQRSDALKQLQQHTPSTTIPLRFHRTFVLICLLAIGSLTLLAVLPNPMTAVLQQQATFQAKIAGQITAIDKLRKDLAQQSDLSLAQKKQIDQTLKALETQLQQAHNSAEAQLALAQAQAKLKQLRDPQIARKAQASAAAASALQHSSNSALISVGQALSKGDSKALHEALQNLADQASRLTPEQRRQLAQEIEAAANQAAQDPALSSALHQLAKALTEGNQSEISDAMESVQKVIDQNSTAQAQDNALNHIAQSLQQSADAIASTTDGTKSPAQSQHQPQSQPGQSQQGAQVQGQQGNNQGRQGQTGTNGNGSTGTDPGKDEQVFVPGQIRSGTSTQSDDPNNTGVVQPGNSQPYKQVLQQYNQMAHAAIDNSNVSPDTKNLVHDYFNALEGQQ